MERIYDLRRLKHTVGITEVLASYGLDTNLRTQHGELVGPCPLPEHEGDRNNRGAFRVRTRSGVWNCQTHCGGGDIVELVAIMEGGDYAAAARRLAHLEVGSSQAVRRHRHHPLPERKIHPRSAFLPYSKTLRLVPEHPYLRARGLQPHTTTTFETGWWPLRGFLEGCIGVRLHDTQGRPLGYAGRRVTKEQAQRLGKWKLPHALPKADILFNWHRARSILQQAVVVVEGPFDAMRVWQAGFRAVVALLGSAATPSQQALLSIVPNVIIMLDGDAAGRDGARSIARTLNCTPVTVVDLPDGYDPAELSDEYIYRLLSPIYFRPVPGVPQPRVGHRNRR